MDEDAYKLQKNLQYQSQGTASYGGSQLSLRPQARSSDYHFAMRLLATDRLVQKVQAHRTANLGHALKMITVYAEVRRQQQEHFQSSKKKEAEVKVADRERALYRAKLQRIYVKKMMDGKRQCELRDAWSCFAENMKLARGVEWDRRRLLRLAWSQLRSECGTKSEDGDQGGVKASEKQLMMRNFMSQKIGDHLAALEGMKRTCFHRWKKAARAKEVRPRTVEVDASHMVGRLGRILQSKLVADLDGAFGILVECNQEEKMQQKLTKSLLYLSGKSRSRDHQLVKSVYRALRASAPGMKPRAYPSLPLQRFANSLASTLQVQQK